MSNETEQKQEQLPASQEEFTSDLRGDDWKPKVTSTVTNPLVKPAIHDPNAPPKIELSLEQQVMVSKLLEEKVRKQVQKSKFDPSMDAQILPKSALKIVDFSELTMDSIYDLNIPIEAKEFMSADGLKIDLADSNFEARWVNKNPQRLGEMIGKGFTYVVPSDLLSSTANKSIQTSLDAEDHYSINDVVAMKIDKATYYPALRAAHLRAIATTDQANARKRAANSANGYMQNESGFGRDFQTARVNKKMEFYDPEIGV